MSVKIIYLQKAQQFEIVKLIIVNFKIGVIKLFGIFGNTYKFNTIKRYNLT